MDLGFGTKKKSPTKVAAFDERKKKIGFFARFIATNAAVFGVQK